VRSLVRRIHSWGVPRAQALYTVAGLWLGLAFVLAFVTFLVFVAVAQQMSAGTLNDWDIAIMRWMNGHSTPGLDGLARQVTQLGSWIVMAVMALLVSAFLWIHGERRALALLWIGLAGVYLLDHSLKDFFGRARPDVFEPLTPRPSSYSFPSGHTLNATVGYTLFAFLVARLESSRALRAATFTIAGILIVLVALSRVYLGVHHPSDVLAGMLVGFTWAMACVFAVYVLRDLRATR